MQMKSVIKVQFRQLNDKRFYFSNGLISLQYRAIHKFIQEKKIRLSKRGKQGTTEASKIKCFETNF